MTLLADEIAVMSAAEMARYPLGIVRVDRDGVITSFNAAEERFVKKFAADVIGLNYFRDVAPCTAVKEFEGRFRAFVENHGATTEIFTFFYRFAWGHKQVLITLVKSRDDSAGVYIITEMFAVA